MKRSRTGKSLGEEHSGECGERGRDSGSREPGTPKVQRRVERPVPGAVGAPSARVDGTDVICSEIPGTRY